MSKPDSLVQTVQNSCDDTPIETLFTAAHKKWNNSSHHQRLIRSLQDSTPQGGYQIEKAVCMALGSLKNPVSIIQLVVFLDIVQFLNTTTKSKIPLEVFAQDPRFTNEDKTFLRALGITILEAPNAERMIRRGVFSFVPNWSLEYQILGRCRGLQPSIHVGRGLKKILKDLYLFNWACWRRLYGDEEEKDRFDEEERRRIDEQRKVYMRQVEAMEENYGIVKIPDGEEFQGLGALEMYVEREVIDDFWPEEVEDEMLLNILEDEETCACCRLPLEKKEDDAHIVPR